jgi:ribonuclease HI
MGTASLYKKLETGSKMKKWKTYIDGGARGNPGPAGVGVHLLDDRGTVRFSGGFFLGRATNNQAEYTGLVRALELLERGGARQIEIISDSQLLVRQLNGEYKVKSPQIKPLYEQARRLLEKFDTWQIGHVRREYNTEADQLANEAMDAGEDITNIDKLDAHASHEDPSRKIDQSAAPAVNVPEVEIRVVEGADPKVCPAAPTKGDVFLFGSMVPDGLCVEACAAVIGTVRVLQQSETLCGDSSQTVVCGKQGCGAVFEIRPIA